jgi:choline dehydrogenase
VELAVQATKAIRETVKQAAWDAYRGAEVTPGENVRTDAEIEAWLRTVAGTNYHPCCSCRMGPNEASVVDSMGRVHGMEGLRIVDASIMPEIVSGNLNAPVIMMAERIADDLRGRAPLAPQKADYYLARTA